MDELPEDHVSNFHPEWWNERRKRDYYVNEAGCVKLRVDSPTGEKLKAKLKQVAALLAMQPQGNA